MNPRHKSFSFTLIELLVVMALMGLAVGMAVINLDGVTDRGRLRSSASQIGAFVQLAQNQARIDGLPRRIVYQIGTDGLRLHKPEKTHNQWQWDHGVSLRTASGVTIEQVLIESIASMPDDEIAINIDSDGRCRSHAVVITLHGQAVVVLLGGLTSATYVFPTRVPRAQIYELLILELADATKAS